MERTLSDGGQELAVLDEGAGPPLVGLHGLTSTRRYVLMGSKAVERAGRRVAVYDARGHGASAPAADGDYSYAALTADLEGVLDALGIERTLIAGVSMGAHTAVRFALAAPERVAGLLLVTPAADPEAEPRLERWDALARGLRDGGIEGFLAAEDLERVPAPWRESVEKAVRQRLAGHRHLSAVADALAAVPRSRPFDAWAELSRIAAPAIVVGSRDEADPEHPLAIARRYADELPDARFVVEDAGRSPIAWQGGQLARLVLEELPAA